jgi:hypothetical protein
VVVVCVCFHFFACLGSGTVNTESLRQQVAALLRRMEMSRGMQRVARETGYTAKHPLGF